MNVAEPTVTSMWASVTNWLTPTVLFCILNLMIGTIFISSSLKTYKKHENHEHGSEGTNSAQLVRAPSLLDRVKSINFSLYRSDQPHPFPSVAQYVDPHEDQEQKAEEAHAVRPESHHIVRSQSETCAEVPSKGAAKRKIKKSASEKIGTFGKENEEEAEVVDCRRPATVRERKGKSSQTTTHEEDEAVDKKADDFINRFRQQLKLQRLDSILRYKEMLNKGAGS